MENFFRKSINLRDCQPVSSTETSLIFPLWFTLQIAVLNLNASGVKSKWELQQHWDSQESCYEGGAAGIFSSPDGQS